MVVCHKCGESVAEATISLVEAGIIERPICDTCYGETVQNDPPMEPERNWKDNAWFPEKYHLADMKDFDNPKLLEMIRNWWKSGSKLLTLTGNVGSGKTHFACAAAYSIHDKAGKICRFVNVPDMMNIFRSAACGDDRAVSRKMMITGCNVLVLDDLGAQRKNEFSYESLYSILSSNQRVIVTTNLDAQGIATELDDRIASRLNGGYIIRFTGRDRRAEGSENRMLTV